MKYDKKMIKIGDVCPDSEVYNIVVYPLYTAIIST